LGTLHPKFGSAMTRISNYSELGSKRLPSHDYSHPGAYFVTICAARRQCIFGDIVDGRMRLNKSGLIVAEQWAGLPSHYANASLDEFVIMPNHVHGIICLTEVDPSSVGAGFQPAHSSPPTNPRHAKPRHGLPEMIRGFKTYSSLGINRLNGPPGNPVWQRNYYEHVVRTEDDLDRVRRYIVENPLKWAEDEENPAVCEMVEANLGGLETRPYEGG